MLAKVCSASITGESGSQIRLFVALDLPEAVKAELKGIARGVEGVRWTPLEQLHLTLRFIGEVDRPMFERIGDQLAAIEAAAFTLTLSGVGAFPGKGAPRVLWAGVQANERLMELQQQIESALNQAGVAPENRPFHPHLTLGRNRNADRMALKNWLEKNQELRLPPIDARSFILYSSRLSAAGAIHKKERVYELARQGSD